MYSDSSFSHRLTLLSPARDAEVARAAIQAGADAVYIGAPRFGARQAASNTLDSLRELVAYAHLYGVQVLVTLNTLLHDDEYAAAVALIHDLYHIGVDALIVQDLRLLSYPLPPIRLHASTQCDNRTAEQVIRLQQLGFRRAVLARELGVAEIRAIHEAVLAYSAEHHETPIELEAFVHGALCVSYSGRCYLSEVVLGRSANRGCCAQMCRMQYDLLDADGRELTDPQGQPIHQRYLLSLQDMDRSAYLQELVEAGVTTFKIEGRLKDAHYVTNLTAYYRQRIDSLYPSERRHIYTYSFTPDPAKTFHRGSTDYFLHGRTPHLANWQTPKSTGEPIGTVVRTERNSLLVKLLPNIELHNGDGISAADQGFSVNRIEPAQLNGVKRIQNKSDNRVQLNREEEVRIYPNHCPNLPSGTPLFRNADTVFLRSLHASRRIPVDIDFSATPTGYRLQMSVQEATPTTQDTIYNTTTQSVNSTLPVSCSLDFESPHEPANNPERARATIVSQLTKLGDTPFVSRTGPEPTLDFFIPIARLNEWRRAVTDELIRRLQSAPAPSADSANTATPFTDLSADSAPQSPNLSAEPALNSPDLSAEFHQHPDLSQTPLMTCRYCLLFEMGHCRRAEPLPKEPRYLRLRNGTLLSLSFDCARCQMLIYKE